MSPSRLLRYSPGVWPVQRLNARWKVLTSEKPSRNATSETDSPGSAR